MILSKTRQSHCWIRALTLVLSGWIGLAPLSYGEQKSTGSTTNAAPAHSQGLVNVNTADVNTLETLPGVGPTIAERIVEGRPYHKLADLEKVKGLSQAKVEALKGKVSFGQPKATRENTTETTKTSHDSSTASASSKRSGSSSSTGNAPTAPTASTAGTAASSTHSAANKLAPGEKININTASIDELDRLPGIGKTKAQAIVDYRTQNGSFRTLEDVEKVKGIKAGSFEKIKDHIKLSD